jgi:hypothetical protein
MFHAKAFADFSSPLLELRQQAEIGHELKMVDKPCPAQTCMARTEEASRSAISLANTDLPSVPLCHSLQSLLNLLLSQSSELVVRAFPAVSPRPADDADFQFALLKINTQDSAQGADT